MKRSSVKGRKQTDIEIDRREYNGHTVVLLEDQAMMKDDSTSGQYIIGIEKINRKSGEPYVSRKRCITDLMCKKGYANAKEGAQAIFSNPEFFEGILGDEWLGYEEKEAMAA